MTQTVLCVPTMSEMVSLGFMAVNLFVSKHLLFSCGGPGCFSEGIPEFPVGNHGHRV